MHDAEFEDRLRLALRNDVESLPFTLTADVVEQRLVERRGVRRARYAVLAAAASVAVLLGGSLVLGRPSNPPIGGTTVPSAPASEPASIPSPTAPTEALMYTCGGPPFPADLFALPGNAHLEDDPATEALRAFLASDSVEADILPETGWYVLTRSADEVIWVAHVAGRDPGFATATVRHVDGRWQIDGFAQCHPTVVTGGLGLATWSLDPAAPSPGPEASSFIALVTERDCASGQPPGDRLLPPSIIYESNRVLVIFTLRPQSGNQDCQGNPSTPVTVELPEPLGNRQLLDGAFLPPADPRPSPVPARSPVPAPKLPDPIDGVATLVDELLGTSEVPSTGGQGIAPPGTDNVVLQLVCLDGNVEVDLDGRHLVYDCDTEPTYFADFFVARADLDVDVRIEGFGAPFAARIGTRDRETDPEIQFIAPPAVMSAPGATARPGAPEGCLSYSLALGGAGGDQCGPIWYSLPDDRALDVTPGSELTLTVAGWSITPRAEYVSNSAIDAGHGFPTGVTPTGFIGATEESFTFAAPPAGDWGIQVYVTGKRGGDSFSTSYFFRVRVTP
jgi:hypothetical protein